MEASSPNSKHRGFRFSLVVTSLLWAAILQAQSLPSAYTTGYRYSAGGLLTGVISPDPDGAGPLAFAAVRNTYSTAGELEVVEVGELLAWQPETVNPASWSSFTVFQIQRLGYDSMGRKVWERSESDGIKHELTQYGYDNMGRVECVAVRMNPTLSGSMPSACSQWLPNGTDGPDRITKTSYDSRGLPLQIVRAYGLALQQAYATYTYDANGMPETVTDANGNKSTMEYDGHDRVYRLYFPSPTSPGTSSSTDYEQYLYDANGNKTSFRNRGGQTIGFTYDALNRMTFKNMPGGSGSDVFSDYELRGLQLYARYGSASGNGVTNTYDGFGRLSTSTINQTGPSRTVGYQYDSNGNKTRITHPDGNYFTYSFDGLDRIYQLKQNGSALLATAVYDSTGRRLQLRRGSNVTTTTYSYDPISRLESLSHDLASSGTSDVTINLIYNPASQITTRSISNTTYEYPIVSAPTLTYTPNGLNQYTQVSSGVPITYGWDAKGNLTSDGASTFTYDPENRLASATGAKSATLNYDPLGRLFQVVSGSVTTRFLYDGNQLIAEYNSSGTLLRRYVHGAGLNEPIVWYEGASVGTNRRYFHADNQGSIVAVADSAGVALQHATYDPYGMQDGTYSFRFQYTGQPWITELGLYYFRTRMYNPGLGRFMQTDPSGYGDNLNLYAYVAGDPINGIDLTGTECTNLDDGTTRCITDSYDVTFKTPEGFQNIRPGADYHYYETLGESPLGEGATRAWVKDNPTPSDPDPATLEGTINDATPLIGFLPGNISPVRSFIATNKVTGREVVVNATLPGHPLGNGIVVRETAPKTTETSTIKNMGEGNGFWQSKAAPDPVRNWINNVWRTEVPSAVIELNYQLCTLGRC